MWRFAFFDQLAQDLRYALRVMTANTVFTATAAISLALGIGANTAIYSFMDAILMRSLPVSHPEQLAVLDWHAMGSLGMAHSINGSMHSYRKTGRESPNFPYAFYDAQRSSRQFFSILFAYTYVRNFNVIASNEAETLPGGFVSGDYFSGLGVPPSAGRLIAAEDDRTGAPAGVVLSYRYWQNRFHGDSAAIGQTIHINNAPFIILGVAARGFFGVDAQSNPSLFLPIHSMPALAADPASEEQSRFFDKNFWWIEMMGRLRPGVSLEQAQAGLYEQFRTFALCTAVSPKETTILPDLALEPGSTGLDTLRRQYSEPLYILMTMVGLILAIACANLANLLLARAAARRREMAVRLSLGAGRWRVVRQMLTESVLLAMLGGTLGVFVGLAGIRFITWLIANGRADFTLRAELSWPVLCFTFALALLAGVLFGLAPALQATKVDFTPGLKESRSIGVPAPGRRFRPRLTHALIVSQIAVSLLLVVAAGLFVRTLTNLHSIDVGFNRESILLFSINGRQAGYKDDSLARFYSGLLDRFRQIPGVRAATASNFPLVAHYVNNEDITVPGRPPRSSGNLTDILNIDPDFFETMQIPVLLGRSLQPGDLASPLVAVVNRKFANDFFDGANPVGRQFAFGSKPGTALIQIVGVIRNAHYNSLQEQPEPVVYLPFTQGVRNLRGLFFELRTAGDPLAVMSFAHRIVHDASPAVSINDVGTQAQRIEQTISQERTFADLGTCFALLALLIASVGLYGAMAFTVARRTGEIGIRMALGAQRRRIVWMVLREVLALTVAGLVIGYVAARFTTQYVESFLFGLKANDTLALATGMAILLAAALVAGYLPAWRAARIDPAVALRNE